MNIHCLKFGFKNILETSDRSYLFDRSLFDKIICLSYSCTPLYGTILHSFSLVLTIYIIELIFMLTPKLCNTMILCTIE